jgi:hypothetical protein
LMDHSYGINDAKASLVAPFDLLPDGYSPSSLDAIEQAFDAVWTTTHKGDSSQALRSRLGIPSSL